MPQKVERFGDRILIDSPNLDDTRRRKCKSLGASWRNTERAWSLPLSMDMCRRLRETFGDDLAIGPQLWAWASEQKEKEAAAGAVLKSDLLHIADEYEPENLKDMVPTMYNAMLKRGYQFQVPAFARLVGSIGLWDQPGLGKTLETFASLIECGIFGRVLIIAPKSSLRATWEPEIRKWLKPDMDVTVTIADSEEGTMAEREQYLKRVLAAEYEGLFHFVIVNAEMMRTNKHCDYDMTKCKGWDSKCRGKESHRIVHAYPSLFAQPWDAIVLDEGHKYMMHANWRSKNCSRVGFGIQKVPLAGHGVKVDITGTPSKGKLRKLWGQLHWLNSKRWSSEWKWSETWFEAEPDEWAQSGKRITNRIKPGMEDGLYADLASVAIRRTKDELRAINPEWAPPSKQFFEVWVSLGKKQRRIYKAMLKAAEVELKGGNLTAEGVLAILTRLKQFASTAGEINDAGEFTPTLPSAKFDWLVTFLDERGILEGEGEGKVIVASQYERFISMIEHELQGLGVEVLRITGKESPKKVVRNVEAFQSADGPRVMLLTTTAGGASITLDAADDVVILDETWVPDEQEQVEDRAHRTSKVDHQVNIWYVRAEDTVERDIAGDNEWYDTTQKRVLDGARGVEFAKERYRINLAR